MKVTTTSLPDDWQEVTVECLKAAEDNALTTGPFGSSIGARFFQSNGVPVIRGGNLSTDGTTRLIDDGFVFLSEEKAREFKRCTASRGDLVFTCWGTINQVGFIGDGAKYSRYIISNKQMKFTPHPDKADGLFLFYLFSGPTLQRQMIDQSIGSSIPGFNLGQLRSMLLRLPPLDEQRAIAAALRDVDAMVEGLDRLIAKKRDLKQAAMQQLLTGHTRLPGFNEEWRTRRIGDVLRVRHGKSQHGIASEGGRFPILATGGEIGRTDSFLYDKPSVLIGRKGTIDAPQFADVPFWSIDTLFFTEIMPEASPKFIFYLFNTINWRNYNEASGVPSLNSMTIESIEVRLPALPEQTAIAAVLSDTDAEIVALEARRDKTRLLKQGMMQELLTGKTRLVAPVAAAAEAKAEPAASAVAAAPAHNWAINEAVVISVLAKTFGSDKFPLGRKRYTKLSYLLHRHVERTAQGYLKKAAGPYNPSTKYKGPEAIAQKNKYIRAHKNGQFSGFVADDGIARAEGYFEKWYGPDALKWLEQFRYKKNDDLEVLATVDMAVQDLRAAGKTVTLDAVKGVISSHQEWEAKLDRPVFADASIAEAMKASEELFG